MKKNRIRSSAGPDGKRAVDESAGTPSDQTARDEIVVARHLSRAVVGERAAALYAETVAAGWAREGSAPCPIRRSALHEARGGEAALRRLGERVGLSALLPDDEETRRLARARILGKLRKKVRGLCSRAADLDAYAVACDLGAHEERDEIGRDLELFSRALDALLGGSAPPVNTTRNARTIRGIAGPTAAGFGRSRGGEER